MINALPFLLGPLMKPIQGTGQTGETGLDQPQTPENSFNNPFAKILRDQSVTSSLLKSLPLTVLSADQKRLPDLESLPGKPDLSPQILAGPDMPVDFLRGSGSDSVELTLSVDAQPHRSPVTFLESDKNKLSKIEAFIQTSSIPSASLGAHGVSEVGEVELPREQTRPSFEGLSHEEQVSGAVFLPQVIFSGESEAELQTKSSITQPDLRFLPGYLVQAPPVGSNQVGNSPVYMVPNANQSQFLQDAVKEISPFIMGASDEELATESIVEHGKNVEKPLDRLPRPVQDVESLVQRMAPPTARAPQGPHNSLVNQAFQAPLPFEETAATFAEGVQLHQNRLKYLNGVSSFLSGAPIPGKETSMALASDRIVDSGLSFTVDRTKEVLETAGKSVGVDPNGGQGVNKGMGGSNHSQPGFQQSSSSLTPGTGARIAEERVADLPTPPLQRLQMDVQLSETNRIQIDVGVQQRQVYAGLLMDHAALKNLAIQFVPQLEDQLAQSDMELQEFSAEVRDHRREQESDTRSQGADTPHVQGGSTTFFHEPESLTNSVKRVGEQGLHLVA